ncbi:hypothetical protein [Haloparvum sp. PAK95]|uniref:hypothetical protein n=1 Tax=Haloparvum sp. PAK95 TaxID=3418962 RepID=UPI003D2F222E
MSDTGASDDDGSDARSPAETGFSRRARLRSAALWGAAAALTFLVLAQGYLLVGGSLPIRLTGLFGLGLLVGLLAAGVTYATEHRLTAKRRV